VRIFEGRRYYQNPDGYYQSWDGHLLHRDIWESLHGPLPPDHVVHHVDLDCDNNNAENLQAIPTAEHRRLHWKIQEKTPLEKKCAYCDEVFQTAQSHGKYCSDACRRRAHEVTHHAERLEAGKRYRASHHDQLVIKNREYLASHRDEINAKKRAWRKAKREGVLRTCGA